MAKKTIPTPEEILKKAVYGKNTIYDYEVYYDMPDGRRISVVRSTSLIDRKEVDRMLIERVQEAYGGTN